MQDASQESISSSSSASSSSWHDWTRRHAVPLAAAAFFVGYAFVFFRGYEISQWQLFKLAARRMVAHETVNVREANMYAYPPAMAMFAMPLAWLPDFTSHALWYGANILAACVTVACAWRLCGGGSLVGISGRTAGVFALAIVLGGRHLLSPLENEQFDMVIAAFLMSGCLALARGQEGRGGVLLGIATSMKMTPALFVPYLVWRGRPQAAAALAAVALGINLAPDFLWPQADGQSYLADWHRNCVRSAVNAPPGEWLGSKANVLNQSLAGWMNRAAMHGLPRTSEVYKKDIPVSPQATQISKWALYSIELWLAGVTAWAFARPFRRWPTPSACEPIGQGAALAPLEQLQHAFECSAVFCLMLLYSPMSSKAHYAPLILPTLLIARLALEQPSRFWKAAVALLALTGPLATKGFLGHRLGVLLLGWGIPTCYPIVALACCWAFLFRRAAAPTDDRPTTPQGTHWHLRQRTGEISRA